MIQGRTDGAAPESGGPGQGQASRHGTFPICGIGASAGGLEALEVLFRAMPTDLGIAFVVVQHLSPDFKSLMEQLLARETKMPIFRVEDGMQVRPDCIYLIPPKKEMIITGGRLLLTEKTDRALNHPIDVFFRSLATDVGRDAIAVVLSGSGSDGSRGICDVHEAGGLVICQDPATAKFNGMPVNARDSGMVDVVLAPEAIPPALRRYLDEDRNPESVAPDEVPAATARGVERVIELIHRRYGIDFAHYKTSTVGRRIQRRILVCSDAGLDAYVDRLEHEPEELDKLYRDLLIGVTQFFRDPEAFAVLEKDVIPDLLTRTDRNGALRLWVAGCATGEEAYSLAMLVHEAMERGGRRVPVKIFATDVDRGSLEIAAAGVYPAAALGNVSSSRRHRYFVGHRDGVQVARELRQMIVFAPHNLIANAPFTQIDLATCRNLLIYFQPAAQKKALSLLHFALNTGGALFLGSSETPGDLADEFQAIDSRWKVYRKWRDARLPVARFPVGTAMTTTPLPRSDRGASGDTEILGVYDRLLEERMPPGFLLDQDFRLVHAFAGAERALRIPSGRITTNFLDLVPAEIRSQVSGALRRALAGDGVVRCGGLRLQSERGDEQRVLTVEPVRGAKLRGTWLLVRLDDAAPRSAPPPAEPGAAASDAELAGDHVRGLENDLRHAQENLQATIEELETSNEELQATNEELVASNEELQSTNEELHSVNEELFTVNAEHQRKIEELTEAHDDMDNLLASTRVGVIFLGADLTIRRFTPEIARVFHLLPQDIGRPIESFSHNLVYDTLREDVARALERQEDIEREVVDRTDTPYLLRIVPYRARGSRQVGGVVLTLIDLELLRSAELAVARLRFITDTAMDLHAVFRSSGRVLDTNQTACEKLGFTRDELLRVTISDLAPQIDLVRFRALYDEAAFHAIPPFESRFRTKDGRSIPVELSLSSFTAQGETLLYATARDISERKKSERLSALEHDVARIVAEGTDIDASLQRVLEVLCRDLEGEVAVYWRPEGDELTLAALSAGAAPDREQRLRETLTGLPIGHAGGIVGEAAATLGARWISRPQRDPALFSASHALRDDVQGLAAFPVAIKKELIGVFAVFFRDAAIDVSATLRTLGTVGQSLAQFVSRLRIEAALVEREHDATTASRAKSEFLANMSHEIRTPMSAVLSFVELLRMRSRDEASVESLDAIQRNARHLLEILDDMLDLSRIEAGKLKIEKDATPVSGLVLDVRSLMSFRASERRIPLRFTVDTPVPSTIRTDRTRVRQILVNLVSNALKFTERGEVRVAISFVSGTSPSLCFHVIDTGIGMTPEQQKRIFEPFTQVHRAARSAETGVGLGLVITKRLVDALDGSIEVESERGRGTTFMVCIPTGPLDGVPFVDHLSSPVIDEDGWWERPQLTGRVLVADDHPDVLRATELLLRGAGAEVLTVSDGREALEAIESQAAAGRPIELVLMDLQMPGMTGEEATSRLRARGCRVPVIALTAAAMKGARERCLEIGFDDYLAKPVKERALLEVVARWIRGATEARTGRAPAGRAAGDAGAAAGDAASAARGADSLLGDFGQSKLPAPSREESLAAANAPRTGLRILIVEDHVDAAQAVAQLLGLIGHDVMIAADGGAAIASFENRLPDVVMIDLGLPDMDGLELVGALRRDPRAQGVAFVALTGRIGQEVRESTERAGFRAFLEKPVDLDGLTRVLDSFSRAHP